MGLVLICSDDVVLSGLIGQTLAQRGMEAHPVAWDPCDQMPDDLVVPPADAIVADLGCPAPACWQAADRLRADFAGVPLVLLTHDWPDRQRLRRWQPCMHLRKPIAVGDLQHLLRCMLQSAAR